MTELQRAVAEVVRAELHKIFRHGPEPEGEPGPFAKLNTKLDWIIKDMGNKATKADLDAGIAQIKQDVVDAAQRATTALGALLDKVNAGEDFTAEVTDLQNAHNQLIQIAGDAAGTTSQPGATPANGEASSPAAASADANAAAGGGLNPGGAQANQGNTTPGGAPGTAAPSAPASTAPTDNADVQAQTAANLSPGGAQGGQSPSGMNQNPG